MVNPELKRKSRKIPLTDVAIGNARPHKKRYKLTDRQGLYVAVMPTGKKVFRYEYRFHGRRETLTLGTYYDASKLDASTKGEVMTLAQARLEHAKARRLVETGTSPAVEKQKKDAAARFKLGTHFEGVATRWLDDRTPHRSAVWREINGRLLKNDINPIIGRHALDDITQADVLACCKRAQDRGSPYTADWIRRTIAAVFSYANSAGLTERNPARAAQGAVVVPQPENKPALKASEIKAIVTKVRSDGGLPGTRIALELLLHTMVRKSELLHAKWTEVDLDGAEWRIPAERMKMGEAHIVPLSTQAVALFKEAKKHCSRSEYVFPSFKSLTKPFSDTVLNNALRRLAFDHVSPHAFRRTASTMLNEKGFRPDIIERQLAHRERNRIRAAYNKATYLPERKQMMQDWSNHVDAIVAGAKVVPIGKGAKSA